MPFFRTGNWTGGQYSVYRVLLGATGMSVALYLNLCVEGTVPQFWLGIVGALLSLLIIVGYQDALAALALAAGMAALYGKLFLAAGLVIHALVPPAPYGSVAAVGRENPAGNWKMPKWIPYISWSALCAVGIYTVLRSDSWDFSSLVQPGMFLLALFCLFPIWLNPAKLETPIKLFYDGNCGLCHRWVRLGLAEDRSGRLLRFSPIGSDTFNSLVSETDRQNLPDSIIVVKHDETLLVRSDAVLYILRALGGVWQVIGAVLLVVPKPLRDLAYDLIARIRHSLFKSPPDLCPIIPKELRDRFI